LPLFVGSTRKSSPVKKKKKKLKATLVAAAKASTATTKDDNYNDKDEDKDEENKDNEYAILNPALRPPCAPTIPATATKTRRHATKLESLREELAAKLAKFTS